MNELPERTLETITAEIAMIKTQTQKILLTSAVEIGQRLLEAKEKIAYGEFQAWVENTLEYSERTAYNLMQLAQEYGSGLPGAADADTNAKIQAKSKAFAKLGYSQALILLGIPAHERAEFITELDIENMAVRELQQAVKERNQALAAADKLQQTQDEQNKKIFQLSTELSAAKTDKNALWTEQGKVIQLQRELATFKDESAAAKRIAKAERESKQAQSNLATARADVHFNLIATEFNDLLAAVKELGTLYPEAFYQYLKKTNTFIESITGALRKIERSGP